MPTVRRTSFVEEEMYEDETLYSVREGIVVIPKGAVIPDGTVI